MSLADALHWARDRASVVLLRLFDSDYFLAGEYNPEPDKIPLWPEDTVVTRRRPRGLEVLDNTPDDPPVLWDLRLRSGEDVDEDGFRASIEADERTLPAPADAHDPSLEGVRVLVRTSTRDQAWVMAESIWTAARAAVPRRPLQGPGPYRAAGYEVYPYAPGHRFGGGSIRVTPAIVSVDGDKEPGD